MSEKSYINCECDFDANTWEVDTCGTIEELGFITTLIANAVRKRFINTGCTDEQAKRIILGGIERFWGSPEFLGRGNEDENLSK